MKEELSMGGTDINVGLVLGTILGLPSIADAGP